MCIIGIHLCRLFCIKEEEEDNTYPSDLKLESFMSSFGIMPTETRQIP